MKKINLFLIFVLVFSLSLVTLAKGEVLEQEKLSLTAESQNLESFEEDIKAQDLGVNEPKILPSNAFYFLKNWRRGIQSFFTSDEIKKAELKLKFANERLIEVKEMVAQGKESEKIIQALEEYDKEMGRLEREVSKIKDKENLKAEQFSEKFIDNVVKQQKLLDTVELKMPAQSYPHVERVKEQTLKRATNSFLKVASPQELQETLEKTIEKEKGSSLKNIKNLEVLQRVEEQVPLPAKEAIQKVQANALNRLHEEIISMPEEERKEMKEYVKNISGNKVRQLEIISNLESKEAPPEVKQALEESKEEIIKEIDQKLQMLETQELKEAYLKPLQQRNRQTEQIINELKENLSPTNSSLIMEMEMKEENNVKEELLDEEIKQPIQSRQEQSQRSPLKKAERTEDSQDLERDENLPSIISPQIIETETEEENNVKEELLDEEIKQQDLEKNE